MTSDADVVVVGAGHNGLICAAYLARAGMEVLVVEARDSVGGCASTVDAIGARVNICNCDHSMIRATSIPEELALARFGLRYLDVDLVQLSLSWTGDAPWFLFRDTEPTLDSLRIAHPGEVANYQRYLRTALPLAALVRDLTLARPITATAMAHLAHLATGANGTVDARRTLGARKRGAAAAATLLAWSRRSVGAVVRSYFNSEALRGPLLTPVPRCGDCHPKRRAPDWEHWATP